MHTPSKGFLREIKLERERVVDWEAFPFSLPSVRTLGSLTLHPSLTLLVGENGSGKSTLLEAIAVAAGFNAEGGSRNFNFSTRKSHSPLDGYLRLVRNPRRERTGYFLRAESFFNVATEIERLDVGGGGSKLINFYGGKSLHEQSHGESFMALVTNRFSRDGLYLLDEPEAALSPRRQLALVSVMHDLINQGCQFLVATHSPFLLAYPDALLYSFSPQGIQRTSFRDTDHYQLSRNFLERPETFYREFLSP